MNLLPYFLVLLSSLFLFSSANTSEYLSLISDHIQNLDKNPELSKNLLGLFKEFDLNHDGYLDFDEINKLKLSGVLSFIGGETLKNAALRDYGIIGPDEFLLMPALIQIISTKSHTPSLHLDPLARFSLQSVLPEEVDEEDNKVDHISTPSLLETTSQLGIGSKFFKFKAKASFKLKLKVKAKIRVRAKLKLGFKAKAKLCIGRTCSKRKVRPRIIVILPPHPDRHLPQSIFGIPDIMSERCVLCQYFIQRIENNFNMVSSTELPSDDDKNSAKTSSEVSGSVGSAFSNNEESATPMVPIGLNAVRILIKASKGRLSAERMLENFFDETMKEVCMDIPHVMKHHCTDFINYHNKEIVINSLYNQETTALICEFIKFCPAGSYSSTSVHLPIFSTKINSAPTSFAQRFCGLLGGPHERTKINRGRFRHIGKQLCGF